LDLEILVVIKIGSSFKTKLILDDGVLLLKNTKNSH